LRIEYSPAVLREIRISSGGADAFGVLYGVRHHQTIRIVATRGRPGLEPVGVFSWHVRGKVFLTEEDLQRFEKLNALVALVISGNHGGFFVRDSAGAIETVQSYQEFVVRRPMARPLAKQRRWPWALAALLALASLLFFIPREPQLALNLHESDGQMRISWNVPTEATLKILDGTERIYIPITPQQSTLTYARQSGDVTVGIGSVEARFVGRALPSSDVAREKASVAALQAKVDSLIVAQALGKTRIEALRRRLQ
jgi:hypothetical protein